MTGGDWTDRRRPVLERYEAFLEARANEGHITLIDRDQLLCDLAAVLRAGAGMECRGKGNVAGMLHQWQREARDPETGERMFP